MDFHSKVMGEKILLNETLMIKLYNLIYYEAEGEVIELLETGAPYAPHVKAKIT